MSDLQTYTITAAAVVAAVAILVQTILLLAIYLASRAMKRQITPLVASLEPLAEQTRQVLEEVRAQTRDVTARAGEVLELSRRQLVRADEFLDEAAARARAQMDRVEMVIDDTIERFQETVALLHRGLLVPLKQLNGLVLGIRATLGVLFGGRRTTVERVTHDEEMFI